MFVPVPTTNSSALNTLVPIRAPAAAKPQPTGGVSSRRGRENGQLIICQSFERNATHSAFVRTPPAIDTPGRSVAGADGGQAAGLDLDYGHVGALVRAYHFGLELALVGQLDRDLGGVGHDVGVGEDLAVGGDAQLIGKNGKAIVFGGAPNLGFSVDPTQPDFNSLTLVSGALLAFMLALGPRASARDFSSDTWPGSRDRAGE